MAYSIEYSTEAAWQLGKLDRAAQIQLLRKIARLAENPELGKPLGNVMKTKRSLRVGKYRAVYSIAGKAVLVARIAHRKSVYY